MDKADNIDLLKQQAPKGIVDPQAAARRIRLATYPPAAAPAPFVDYYWIVEWDMRGRTPETQRVLPYPNAHLVFEQGQTAIHGVVRGAYDKLLTGAGKVLGVRFKPGGLRPFIDQPLASFTDQTIAADKLLDIPGAQAEQRVLSQVDDLSMVAEAQAMLLAVLPHVDSAGLLAAQLVDAAAARHGPINVAQLCARMDISERSLQRLFSNYVGVPPKWIIQRYRLQEAIWHLAQPDCSELAELAQQLGFFDQAHLHRRFVELVGQTPLHYRQSQLKTTQTAA